MAKKVIQPRVIETVNKPYELMLLMSPDLLESALKKKLKEVTQMIETAGGKITLEDIWGKQPLAYRIKGNTEGIYVVYNAEIPQTFLKELNEFLRIEKDVLRSLLMSIPADYEYTRYEVEVAPKKEVKAPTRRAKKTSEEKKADEKKIEKKLDSVLDGDDLKL